MELRIFGVEGLPEISAGDDLAGLIAASGAGLADGDVVVVTSKAVSKAEGRLVTMSREEAVEQETVRVVARRGDTRIVETRHGFVLAAAGVDASNVPPGTVALLPVDPDASARRIREGLRSLAGVDVAVLVTDTMGRPWRNGLVDVCIGAAGLDVLDDLRGRVDPAGHRLDVTVTAVADELAAAAELVKGKLAGVPVAVVRGWARRGPGPHEDAGARPLVRSADEDLFRLGTAEAKRAALLEQPTVRAFTDRPVGVWPVERATAAGLAAAGTGAESPWRFLTVTDRRQRLAAVPTRPDDRDLVRTAPAVVVVCHAEPRPAELPELPLTAGAVVERVLLSLAADGLGSCWLRGLDADGVRRALELPPAWLPVATVAIGHPGEPPAGTAGRPVTEHALDR